MEGRRVVSTTLCASRRACGHLSSRVDREITRYAVVDPADLIVTVSVLSVYHASPSLNVIYLLAHVSQRRAAA